MALNLATKQEIVEEVNAIASSALSAVVAEYSGITVEQMTVLRKKARDQRVFLKVVKNTLAKRAVNDTDFDCMRDALVGPVLCAFSLEEPGSAARLLKDFAKECESLKVTAVSVGGNLYGKSHLEAVAALPTKDEAIAQLMQLMLAPVTKLTRTLNEVPTKTVRAFAAVRDAKQAA